MIYRPHKYQDYSKNHIIENPYCGLFLEMGLGKTVTTLTAINELMYERFEVSKVLVIAPLRVAEDTWPEEIKKWDHLKHLTVSTVLGTETKRKQALKQPADIYVINRENVPWLVGFYGGSFPFDMLIIDELSSFKSAKAIRFKALRQVRPLIKRVVGLTGTPAPNTLIDLWPQMYLLDQGERLGKTITGYRQKYFTPGKGNGQVVFNYRIRPEAERDIFSRISDICISMKSEDYLTLPKRIDRKVGITLPEKIKKQYEEFERYQVLKLMEGDINAVNAAGLSNKLLQFANGAVYDDTKEFHEVHSRKLEKLEEILDTANGQPVLVFYSFKHDLARIENVLKKYKPRRITGPKDIEDWNSGKIQLLLAHPAGAGHGLNLQAGGNIIVWFGMTWSLELYQQANARLHRQGQDKPVIIHHLLTEGTMDFDVMTALEDKADGQNALMDAVKARIDKIKKGVSSGET